jgi:uncharacterized protein (TIGR02300 family)
VSKPEWGIKRICQSCGAKFYDLKSSPIICPSCSAKFDPDALLRGRRPRSTAAPKAAPVKAAEKPPKPATVDEDENPQETDEVKVAEEELDTDTDTDEDLGDSGDEALIEDTSELGDDDDVSEVVAGAADDDEEER